MSRARAAMEAAAVSYADLAEAAAVPLPKLTGTTVTECIELGVGAAIVHDRAGVRVVADFDPEAATPTVLATWAELSMEVADGAKPSKVAQQLVLRERGALLALRQHVVRGQLAVAA